MQNSPVEKQRLAGFKPVLELRALLLAAVRKFFHGRKYLEVETPHLVRTPALELHIDALPAGAGYLRTSPELHMKRLLAAGYGRIFQIGQCFRAGEKGRLHNPEFTMLEWYCGDADYLDILAETEALLKYVARACLGKAVLQGNGQAAALGKEWKIFSVGELFEKYAGWNPVADFDERRFEEDLVNRVEPQLPKDFPVVLKDYPAPAAALARLKAADQRVAERWELYLGGIEIANAFSELTDAHEQRQRFEECARQRAKLGKELYKLDEEFLAALAGGLPSAAGVALGLDRLVMLLAGVETLAEVLPFRRP